MLRISQVCKLLGVCSTTLRNLERRAGLLITRDQAGHRRYSNTDLQILEQIFFRSTSQKGDQK